MIEVKEDGTCNVVGQNGGGSETCRVRFAELGIEYGQIYEGDIEVLYMMLNRRIKRYTKEPGCKLTTMHMSKRVKIDKRTNGTIRSAYLYINAHYFTQRECVSFNPNGFIGFAGEMSLANTAPICEAFMEWCDYMEGCKDA